MSNFLSELKGYFTEEERKSEFYRIIATIGINTEKAIYEEIQSEIRRAVEAVAFPDHKLRSWLATFFMPVRHNTSARGVCRVVPSTNDKVSIPTSEVTIIGRNGKNYYLLGGALNFEDGEEVVARFVQGSVKTDRKSYSEFISIPVDGASLDLSEIRVSFTPDGESIPMVESFPSMPQVPFELLGSNNDLFLNNIKALWNAVTSTSIRPADGFFPFYYNGNLYIKIFKTNPTGIRIGTDGFVADPEGKDVYVTYRLSDGEAGNIGRNEFETFDVSGTVDVGDMQFTVYNEPARNGINEPTRAELINLLRRRFYATTNVSSIPEYTTWYKSQPEVGDCLVLSDYYKWRMSGRVGYTGEDITGVVDVYLLDNDMEDMANRSCRGSLRDCNDDDCLWHKLDRRLLPFRDIAFLEYKRVTEFYHFFVVQYRAAFDDSVFTDHPAIEEAIKSLYSKAYVQSTDSSLFRDLDMEEVYSAARGVSEAAGLRILPYHYYERRYGWDAEDDLDSDSVMKLFWSNHCRIRLRIDTFR